jgi:hypothetical protein
VLPLSSDVLLVLCWHSPSGSIHCSELHLLISSAAWASDGQQVPRKVESQSLDKMAEVKADIEKQQMVAALKKADGQASTEAKPSSGASSAVGDACHTQLNTELWGDVVVSGSMLKKDSAGECCEACRAVKPKGENDLDCNGAQAARQCCAPLAWHLTDQAACNVVLEA